MSFLAVIANHAYPITPGRAAEPLAASRGSPGRGELG
jgi:hypothetical protein